MGQKFFFFAFLKAFAIIFPENDPKYEIRCYLYLTANILSGKILYLKLRTKVLSENKIAKVLKVK